MPRFFFNVRDGKYIPDDEGFVLADIDAARAQAIRASGECLRDMDQKFWDGTEWRMEVADENGATVFVLRFSANEPVSFSAKEPASAA